MKVSKEQFDKVLDSYGREKLTSDTTAICEPPLTTIRDSANNAFAHGRVAWIVRNSGMPKEWDPGPDEYFIEQAYSHLL